MEQSRDAGTGRAGSLLEPRRSGKEGRKPVHHFQQLRAGADRSVPNNGGRGQISTGYVEMSNVDLSTEFTNLIVTQRGFQANTRIITVVDQLLQDVIDLKR